jgi:acyl carrier protein
MSSEETTATLGRLRRIITSNYGLEESQLVPAATLEELGIDSMSTIDLLFNIEDEFNITIGREQMELKTVQDVVNYIDRLIADQPGCRFGETAA